MHHTTQNQNPSQDPVGAPIPQFPQGVEMHLYTRYEHGNLPVRVFRDEDGETRYGVTPKDPGGTELVHGSARQLIASLYGHDVHMPFDRYFRLGRYRRRGRASGQADLLTLLDSDGEHDTWRTPVVVHGRDIEVPRETDVAVDPGDGGEKDSPDEDVLEFIAAMEGDLKPLDHFVEPTDELVAAFDKSFALELDRIEGTVGIELDERSQRSGSKFKADEVRRLLWRGFAGKMLSQGYDPDDVLQEVYRGLLVRNNGTCPWDGRKSTFGHYVHMVIGCVLTNYHRKQVRRKREEIVPLDSRDGEERVTDVGQHGSCRIEDGSEVGDMLALEQLAEYLRGLPDGTPEAELGRQILPLVASGHQRGEIVRETGRRPSLVSRALAWLRRQTALWATESGMGRNVPARYLMAPS
jgi:DNA-directed RNA polymerase specialized sigma24 family protein